MLRLVRGCGYCTTPDCSEYPAEGRLGGVFCLNSERFRCGRCGVDGHIELERAEWSGTGRWREVRYRHSFDPRTRSYRGESVLIDTSVRAPGAAFTWTSPLQRCGARALRQAETFLAALQRGTLPADIGLGCGDAVVSFDEDRALLRVKLAAWANVSAALL